MPTLEAYGWNESLARALDDLALARFVPARVIADHGSVLRVVMPEERLAEISGRLQYFADHADLPKVGDWVAVQPQDEGSVIIEAVLPRASEISRKAPGDKAEKQVLAVNIDVAFLVQSLDDDFSPERLQRYIFQLKDSAIQPVIVLNKADQAGDLVPFIAEIEMTGVPYVVCSAATGDGVDGLTAHLKPGQTAVLLGSSGVGKSTLTNRLLGREAQRTQAVREEDSKGRHTTTHREVFLLAGGGLLIDTPGIRELQLWGSEEELQDTFDDIQALMAQCRYSNCRHGTEDGCAIQAALKDGSLDHARYANFIKMQRELAYLQTKLDPEAQRQKKQAISKQLKQHYKTQKSSPKHKK